MGAKPHAVLQGPVAGTAVSSGQGRPTAGGPSGSCRMSFQELAWVIESESREGELGDHGGTSQGLPE